MRLNNFYLFLLQLIITLCASLINGYVMNRITDLNELNTFPRLRLLESTAANLSPLPLLLIDDETPSQQRSHQRRSVTTDDELRLRLARLRQSEAQLSLQNGNLPKTYSKKSQQLGYKTLKKFNNGGSRNCFFTPIQCLVQVDLKKYKKLLDTSSMRFAPSTFEE